MLDAIIFDVDGTLWDARRQLLHAWDMAKRELYGEPFTIDFDVYTSLFGKPMDAFANYVFPGLPLEEAISKTNAVLDGETKWLMEQPGVVYAGVPDMLKTLSKQYPLFIVSNCQIGYIDVLLETGGLSPYITDHLCYGQTLTSKGETIRTLMRKHGLKHVVYVGDTQGDCDACTEAGVPFLFVEYGFGCVEQDVPHAKTPADIPRAIAQME